jgi:hypothetical protein
MKSETKLFEKHGVRDSTMCILLFTERTTRLKRRVELDWEADVGNLLSDNLHTPHKNFETLRSQAATFMIPAKLYI